MNRKRPAAALVEPLTLDGVYDELQATRAYSGAREGGAKFYRAVERQAADGPSTLTELFKWPHRYLKQLVDPSKSEAALRGHRLQEIFGKGIVVHTGHSGTRNGEAAMAALHMAACAAGMAPSDAVRCHRACDVSKTSRKCLLNSGASGPHHVHDDLLDALTPTMRCKFEGMLLDSPTAPGMKRAAFKAIFKVMDDALAAGTLFKEDGKAYCHKCRDLCPVYSKDLPGYADPITMLISGTACTAWSTSGKHERQTHANTLVWLVWVAYIKHFKPDIVIHEITELHPDEIFDFHFQDDYSILPIFVSPWHVGFPNCRPRKYRILARRERLCCFGSSDGFFKLLEVTVRIQAEALMCADTEMVADCLRSRAAKRMRLSRDGAMPTPEDVLTPSQRGRLQQQRGSANPGILSCFFADMAKSADMRQATKYTPTLEQNSQVWSEGLHREAVVHEQLIFQGIPTLPAVSETLQCHWAHLIGKPDLSGLSESECRSLAGNAMHMAVVGAVRAYALCSVHRMSQSIRFRSLNSSSLTAGGDEDGDASDQNYE